MEAMDKLQRECLSCRDCPLSQGRHNVVFGVGDPESDLIRPKLIVCLGRIAAMAVIKPDFRITREHGQWFDIESARAMAIYHPSALLRDITKRPETFADLRSLRSEAKRVCERLYK